MRKYLCAKAIAALICASASLVAGAQDINNKRMDGMMARKAFRQSQQAVSALISCDDAVQLADEIAAAGYHATPVGATLVSARMPGTYVGKLAQHEGIRYIQTPRSARIAMSEARPASGIDRVHSGEQLETPYTGKGVIVAVIDQGFEYRHVAFLDAAGQPRVKVVWDRQGYSQGIDSEPETDIPASGDRIGDIGHATFVTNVAAGSRIPENDLCGAAPEADIVMISSELNEAEVLEDVRFISDYAASQGKPWVINMSFGTQLGAHDGTSYFDQALNDILGEAPGRQIVAASGNDYQNPIHAQHTFTTDGEVAHLLVNPVVFTGTRMSIWSQSTDSAAHISIRPYLLKGDEKDYRDDSFWAEHITEQIAPYNKKQNIYVELTAADVPQLGIYLGLEITGAAGQTFDAWIESNGGSFTTLPGAPYIEGDHDYTISEMGASLTAGITTSAYISNTSIVNRNGATINPGIGNSGDISTFSNQGPLLNGVRKPDIAAPGGFITSAYSKLGNEFSTSSTWLVEPVRRGIRTYYYGASYGTSFSTPLVAGTIALWLQANPQLTAAQIQDIVHSTATKDAFTGTAEWDKRWGYGKLNAYEGLKAALRLADESAVEAVKGSVQPLSIYRSDHRWKLLLSSEEPYLDIDIYTTSGTLVGQQTHRHLHRGDEISLDFTPQPRGTYLVHVRTESARYTHKLLIK